MRVCSVKIDNLSAEEIRKKIENFLTGRQHYVVLPYSLFLLRAQKDEEFKKILNEASLSISDGFGPVLAARILNQEKLQRFFGVDFVFLLGEVAARKDKKIFLFGAQEGMAAKTARVLKNKFPDLKIAGTCPGWGRDEDYVLELINEVRPDILVVALGMPKQEKWIIKNLSRMPSVKIAVGVGGAFDFISGRVKRAPGYLQKTGLEWLWRIFVEPRKLLRNLKAVGGLSWLILEHKLKRQKSKRKTTTKN